VLDIARGDPDGAVLDIGMTAFVARDLDPKGPSLILPCQRNDAKVAENNSVRRVFGVVMRMNSISSRKPRLSIHRPRQGRLPSIPRGRDSRAQVVAQSAGRPDDDVSARRKLALFTARIHAAEAGDHAPIRILIKPREFAMDLQGEFARWRDDQGKRCGGRSNRSPPLRRFLAIASP
jgi:hypothetical protein